MLRGPADVATWTTEVLTLLAMARVALERGDGAARLAEAGELFRRAGTRRWPWPAGPSRRCWCTAPRPCRCR
jgi:hypothetical protein